MIELSLRGVRSIKDYFRPIAVPPSSQCNQGFSNDPWGQRTIR
jgi:hypothetical protein